MFKITQEVEQFILRNQNIIAFEKKKYMYIFLLLE